MTTTGAHYWRTLIGHDAWQRIVSRWGGHEYCIPTRIQSESGEALIGLAGYDAAIKLIAHASGDRIYIAAGWEEILLARYTHIVALRNAGKTNSEISRTFTYISGYTPRHVRAICNGRFEDMKEILRNQPELPF